MFNANAPLTDQMRGASIDWFNLKQYAIDSINVLQRTGDNMKSMVITGFKMAAAISGHDYGTILTCLQQEKLDLEAVIAAIKEEFHLEDSDVPSREPGADS